MIHFFRKEIAREGGERIVERGDGGELIDGRGKDGKKGLLGEGKMERKDSWEMGEKKDCWERGRE